MEKCWRKEIKHSKKAYNGKDTINKPSCEFPDDKCYDEKENSRCIFAETRTGQELGERIENCIHKNHILLGKSISWKIIIGVSIRLQLLFTVCYISTTFRLTFLRKL